MPGGGSMEITDHWAFLDEVEAPMWADLTIEAELMEKDIDDDWFQRSHPIHGISSNCLKSSCLVPMKSSELLGHLPKLPDSVSRSRGKHYRIKKWTGDEILVSMDSPHPIRKLGGESSSLSTGRSLTSIAPTRTITTNSSLKKLHPKKNSKPKSTLVAETRSSVQAASKHSCIKPQKSFGCKNNSSFAKSVNMKASSLTSDTLSGDINDNKHQQNRKSTASKSSVGSSHSIQSKLERVDSAAMLSVERTIEKKIARTSISFLKLSESRILDKNLKPQRNCSGTQPICQESKSKVFGITAPRNPLSVRNGSQQVKERAVNRTRPTGGAGKFNSETSRNKENIVQGKLQNPKVIKCGKKLLTANASSCPKGKANGEKPGANGKKLVSRTYLR